MKIGKILVPVAGNGSDDEALLAACGVARRNKARIYVIYVIKIPRVTDLGAEVPPEIEKGERVLDHAEQVADAADATVETELLQSREIGPAIVDEAAERGVDIIVLGIQYKKRFGEFGLGDTANYVVKNAPCRVWICREAMPATAEY